MSQHIECPHHEYLKSSLIYCQNQKELLSARHDDFVYLIDELKTDLDSLSCEVSQVHQECLDNIHDSNSESSNVVAVKKSETKTKDPLPEDAVQSTLEDAVKETDGDLLELQKNNETLRRQIEHLHSAIRDREKRIDELNTMLVSLTQENVDSSGKDEKAPPKPMLGDDPETRALQSQLLQANQKIELLLNDLEKSRKQEYFQQVETRKLNDELNDNKRKNCDLTIQVQRLASLLKSQEEHRKDLIEKYEVMEKNNDERARMLRTANTQLAGLQERFISMEKRYERHSIERNFLRDEVVSLKEREAINLGKQKSMEDQLINRDQEVANARNAIKSLQSALHHNEQMHYQTVQQLELNVEDLRDQHRKTVINYENLEEEYKKEVMARRENAKIIASFRRLKDEQCKTKEATDRNLKQYADHINDLLNERQSFQDQIRVLKQSYTTLQAEFNRLKACTFSCSGDCDNSESTIQARIDTLREASRRISEQSELLKSQGDHCTGYHPNPTCPNEDFRSPRT